MAAASEMVVTPLYPDPRRLRARSPPNPSAPRYYHRRPHPLSTIAVAVTAATITAAAPRVSLRSFPFQALFFCPTVRHSRVHRDKAAASVPFYQSTEKISRRSCRPARLRGLDLRIGYARKREQPSSMLREYKYINTLHVYMYIALELPLAFIWPREIARTSR